MEKTEIDKIVKAGEIAQELRKFARELIKPGMNLGEIAVAIDDKIAALGAKPGFPVNLSINEVAAHYTPKFNDDKVAQGLLKVDIGIHIDGYIADTAFTLDLDGTDENKKLIQTAEAAVTASTESFAIGVKLTDIGKKIAEVIKKNGCEPIVNLSGHSIERFIVHAGKIVPNYNSGQTDFLEEGLYATEPFATTGHGRVKDGGPSGIYRLDSEGNIRDNFSREVLKFIAEEYQTLPFASRWIHKKFGSRGMLALSMLERAGILYQYPQLIEVSGKNVAQAEHTVLLLGDGIKIITTKE